MVLFLQTPKKQTQAIRVFRKYFWHAAFIFVILLSIFPLSAEASWGSFFEKILPFGKKSQVEELCSSALSLQDVVRFALRNNLQTKLALEQIQESKGQRMQAVSELLPHVEAGISQTRTGRENLAAIGFKSFGLIGPFDTFDARFRLTQKIFDLSAFSRSQAGNEGVKVRQYEEEFARQKVILTASVSYLAALRNRGEYKAAKANTKLAQRLLRQAEHQHDAQIATGVDVARASTRLAEEQFQLEDTSRGLTESYFELERVAGLPYEEKISLSDSLSYFKDPEPSLESAMEIALASRLEARILKGLIRSENYSLRAAKAEMLPKIELTGDYGLSGVTPHHSDRQTGGIMIGASMPLFEGGKIWGTIKEQSSQKRQLQLQLDDLTRQIEEDVRLALLRIKTGRKQVKTARSILDLAARELKMARDRFGAGLGDNVEVIAAQATLARARDTYILALTQYHVARLNLYFALGQTGSFNLKNTGQEKE